MGEKGTWFEDDNDGSVKHLQGARKAGTDTVPLVFLGTDERNVPEEEKTLLIKDPTPELNKTNPPVFALDVSRLSADKLDALKNGREFVDARKAAVGFQSWEAGVFAQAKSMVDWNARNKARSPLDPLLSFALRLTTPTSASSSTASVLRWMRSKDGENWGRLDLCRYWS